MPTEAEKKALLTRAFSSEEGTRAAYRAAKLPIPIRLEDTFGARAVSFMKAMVKAYPKIPGQEMPDLSDLEPDAEK